MVPAKEQSRNTNNPESFFMKQLIISLALLTTTLLSHAQLGPRLEIIETGINSNFRGLSVVNDNIIWVSGSNGTVGKSSNGGMKQHM